MPGIFADEGAMEEPQLENLESGTSDGVGIAKSLRPLRCSCFFASGIVVVEGGYTGAVELGIIGDLSSNPIGEGRNDCRGCVGVFSTIPLLFPPSFVEASFCPANSALCCAWRWRIISAGNGHSDTQNLGTAPELPSPSTGTTIVSSGSTSSSVGLGALTPGLRWTRTRWTKHHPSMYSSSIDTVSPIVMGNSSDRLGVNVAVTTIVRGSGWPSNPLVVSVTISSEDAMLGGTIDSGRSVEEAAVSCAR